MPITFPISTTAFMRTLLIAELSFDDPENVETNITGGGEIMKAELAPQLWSGEATLGKMTDTEARNADVLLSLLRGPAATFFAYDTRRPGPQLDRNGAILGAAAVIINSLPTSREMSLSGLPAAYVLSRGDWLHFNYAGRRALHRVVDVTVTASGTGVTPVFEVQPVVRAGAVTGTSITLIRAACKAVLVAGGVTKGTGARTIYSGMSFRWQQTLR